MLKTLDAPILQERIAVRLKGIDISDELLMSFCQDNPDLQFERNGKNELIIMPPTYSQTGKINFLVMFQLGKWNEIAQEGEIFDSSTGFKMSDDSILSPDVAWIKKDRWEALSHTQREKEFAPICPDFLIEIRSSTDRLSKIQTKMENWISYGCQEAWLIDIAEKQVYIYTPNNTQPQIFSNINTPISAFTLSGFSLDLGKIF